MASTLPHVLFSPACGGLRDVDTQAGEIALTKFRVDSLNWVDDDLPLQHRFAWQAGAMTAVTATGWTILSKWSQATYFENLIIGKVGTVSVRAEAQDTLGSISAAMAEGTVATTAWEGGGSEKMNWVRGTARNLIIVPPWLSFRYGAVDAPLSCWRPVCPSLAELAADSGDSGWDLHQFARTWPESDLLGPNLAASLTESARFGPHLARTRQSVADFKHDADPTLAKHRPNSGPKRPNFRRTWAKSG